MLVEWYILPSLVHNTVVNRKDTSTHVMDICVHGELIESRFEVIHVCIIAQWLPHDFMEKIKNYYSNIQILCSNPIILYQST